MTVKTYSLRLDGQTSLSANFKVREFACKDGSDIVLICSRLVALLQRLRDHFGAPVTITSAYRTASHNKAVGGASQSQHLLGTAADIVVSGVQPLAVAQYAEALGFGGIGLYSDFTHLDTRAVKYRWDQRSGRAVAVAGFGGQSFAQQVQTKAGLDDNTMRYLAEYRFGAELLEKLARAMA